MRDGSDSPDDGVVHDAQDGGLLPQPKRRTDLRHGSKQGYRTETPRQDLDRGKHQVGRAEQRVEHARDLTDHRIHRDTVDQPEPRHVGLHHRRRGLHRLPTGG